MPPESAFVLAAIAVLGLAAALLREPVRSSLLNGSRCVARHGAFLRIPATFGAGYAAFQLIATAGLHWRMAEPFPLFAWEPAADIGPLAAGAWLPALERAAAAFTAFPATFPLSAWFALLFLVNAGGGLATLFRALVRRGGRFSAVTVTLLLAISALAALLKPAAYLFLPEIAERGSLLVPMALDALSCAFEILVGAYFLTYLMLLALVWLRGLAFDRAALRRFAMRRCGYVMKWSLLLVAASWLFVLLPTMFAVFIVPGEPSADQILAFATGPGRGAVTALTLILLPVPAVLVFHNESLATALGDGRRLLQRNAATIVPLLVAAFAGELLLGVGADYVGRRLGGETLAALGWRVVTGAAEGALAGWFLASWVCLYKRLSARRNGRVEVPF